MMVAADGWQKQAKSVQRQVEAAREEWIQQSTDLYSKIRVTVAVRMES